MFLQNKGEVAEQAKTRPKIEKILSIYEFSNSGTRQAVEDFLTWLKENKFTYGWASTNAWKIAYKGDRIGTIRFQGGSLCLDPYMGEGDESYENYLAANNLQETIWANVHPCVACFVKCAMRGLVTIAGKEFNNICCVRFTDPDPVEINCMKKLLEWYKRHTHGTVKRPLFDPAADGLCRIDNPLRISGVFDLRGVSNENAEKLFDGDYSKRFYAGPYGPYKSDGRNCDIVFQLDEPAAVAMYSLVTVSIPDKWTLYGANSNDGPWVQLDTRVKTDAFPDTVTKYTEKAFTVAAPGAYQFYKITLEGWAYELAQVHFYTNP
ncbi:MAG: hypothetical protein FWC32_01645 [Firmicutes bacterium]|nr:hypothetical protein [Bacillota bacterium]